MRKVNYFLLVIILFCSFQLASDNRPPFGSFDTPLDKAQVTGSVAITGWALDDGGVDNVKIYYEENGSLIPVGEGLFVEGVRTDIAALYPNYPNNTSAGWGYMLLSNMLPGGGNSSFVIHVIATDNTGLSTTLGVKTIYCDNANAIKPFGAIDSPAPGETIGGKYRIQGWALTPPPNKIPEDGSTIRVLVDNVDVGQVSYNNNRPDIEALFPEYANSAGAMGYFDLDTTIYEKGMHQLSWNVTDDAGNIEGIGSRYFNIDNSLLYQDVEVPSSVKKIVLVTDGHYEIVNVDSTQLNLDIGSKKGRPTGFIFLDENDELLGILNFETNGGNMNILPLVSLTSNTIDLGKISFGVNTEGIKVAIPENDPIGPGKTINMTEAQKERVTYLSNIFSATLKNLDLNGNGIMDYKDDRLYIHSFQYHYLAGVVPGYNVVDGTWGSNNFTTPLFNGFYTRCAIITKDNSSGNVFFGRYLMEFPDSWDESWDRGHYTGHYNNDNYTQNTNGQNGDTHYPTNGTYTFSIDDDGPEYQVQFSIDHQEQVKNNAFIPFPTIYIEDGMLKKISWHWKRNQAFSNGPIIPDWLIRDVCVEISDWINSGTETSPIHSKIRIYNSYGDSERYEWEGISINGKTAEHTIGVSNLPWIECDEIAIAYQEGFSSNHVVVQFKRENILFQILR